MDSPNLDRALRIKTNSERGGVVENVYMRNVEVGQVGQAVLKINFFYSDVDVGDHTPSVRNINLENVTCEKSDYGIWIKGYERSPITGVTLINCSFNNVEKGNVLEGVTDLELRRVTINGERVH